MRTTVHAAGVVAEAPFAQAEIELRRVRELRRAAESAVDGIEALLELRKCARGRLDGQRVGGVRRLERIERTREAFALLGNRGALLVVGSGEPRQEIEEARHAVARQLREIGAGEIRRAVRREEHRERPAARAARHQRVRRLVDLVEVGPLLAVDLDVHEVLVHDRRDGRVLERFVRHDVAPVARRVADRQQDRLVLRFSRG